MHGTEIRAGFFFRCLCCNVAPAQSIDRVCKGRNRSILNYGCLCKYFSEVLRGDKACSLFKLVSVYLQPADIYLIDEPSAYLDSEQRLVAAKVIKRYVSKSSYLLN